MPPMHESADRRCHLGHIITNARVKCSFSFAPSYRILCDFVGGALARPVGWPPAWAAPAPYDPLPPISPEAWQAVCCRFGRGGSIMMKSLPRLRLQGFNNLTKALSFNIYDICYAVSEDQRRRYIEYIDEQYDADRLTQILTDVAEIIGANILNIARQDYDPQGASVTMLISEEPVLAKLGRDTISGAVVAHMDKSHITVHTYPETHPHNGIATFRADIDVATCGVISPLKALNYLIDSFESDIVVCDYRVRGFTRDVKGKKHFIDHKINSVQDYLARH